MARREKPCIRVERVGDMIAVTLEPVIHGQRRKQPAVLVPGTDKVQARAELVRIISEARGLGTT
jgi:hypothetical protein